MLLQHHSATRLGVFSFATPIVGVLLSAWILDEDISVWLRAVLLVTIGIMVANQADNFLQKIGRSITSALRGLLKAMYLTLKS